jgi:GrpB-like predicted nucleotidyltransferase (UPF0157 family)
VLGSVPLPSGEVNAQRWVRAIAMSEVRVVPPDPSWPTQFQIEAARIRQVFTECDVEIHHIGSTAIRGIFAKPIVDMLLVADNLEVFDDNIPTMQAIGYEAMGEFGIPGRRYFRKNSASGVRTHHLHSFARGSAEAERHLAFRDYMNSHPEIANEYSALKQQLASEFPDDMNAYMDGKDSFIKLHEARALAAVSQP